MEFSIKKDGTWKKTTPYIKIDNNWKTVNSGYVNVDGEWRIFYKPQDSQIQQAFFVAISLGYSDIAAYSTDGITWTQTTMPENISWSYVAAKNDIIVF